MAGGIQKGTSATSEDSLKLQKRLGIAARAVYEIRKFDITGLDRKYRIPKEIIPYGVGSLQADGLSWFIGKKLVLVVEAKHQGDKGNAIERWYKNNYIAREINPKVWYLTFASGSGTLPKSSIWRTLHIAHRGLYNQYNPEYNSLFLSKDGFSIESMVTHIDAVLTMIKERA